MKLTELKIKRKSLADEARTIRAEEQKLKAQGLGPSPQYHSLWDHRTGKVRHCARYAHLAHAYLTGTPYRRVEASVRPLNWVDTRRLMKEVRPFDPAFAAMDEEMQYRRIDTWLTVPVAKSEKAA